MAVLLGPFEIGYPVAFRTGGDTTRDAFEKHIHEIEKIYGILNALDNGKVSSDDLDKLGNDLESALQDHINSTNPHPKWKISFDDLTGQLDGSKLKGKINAALVYGLLSNANIDASHVNNLQSFVENLIPPSGGTGDGITEKDLKDNGYVKFANGFIVQWGTHTATGGTGFDTSASGGTISFPTAFSSKCFALIHSFHPSVGHTNLNWQTASVSAPDKTGFTISINEWRDNARSSASSGWSVTYIAIGM